LPSLAVSIADNSLLSSFSSVVSAFTAADFLTIISLDSQVPPLEDNHL
jgi:hypothetical protein